MFFVLNLVTTRCSNSEILKLARLYEGLCVKFKEYLYFPLISYVKGLDVTFSRQTSF